MGGRGSNSSSAKGVMKGVHGSAKLKLSQAMTPEMELAAIDARLKELKEQEKEYSEAGAWFITNGFEYKRSLYKVNPTEAEKEEIKRREHAGESLMQRGYKYNYKAQDTRDEIIKLEDRRREVYANTAAGIRAQAAATQARRQTAFEGLVKERTRLQTEALQWQNSRAFNREQRERRRKADIELGGSNTKRGQEARRVADKLDASYRDMVDNHIKELTKVINAGVNSPLLDEYLPGH